MKPLSVIELLLLLLLLLLYVMYAADITSSLLLQSLMRPLSASEQQTMSQLSLAAQPPQPSSTTIRLNPLHGGAPLGPQPLNKDHLVRLAMLDAAYRHLPHPSDSERLRSDAFCRRICRIFSKNSY